MKKAILYPRHPAIFYDTASPEEPGLEAQIREIEQGEVMRRLAALRFELDGHRRSKKKFNCWNCKNEFQTQDMVLHRFVSYSSGPDEDRYEDLNLICAGCGAYSHVDPKKTNQSPFQRTDEWEEQ